MELLKDDQLVHRLEDALTQEAVSVKEEQSLLQERLTKLETTRQDFSEAVYQKVKKDYHDRFQRTTEKLNHLRQGLEKDRQEVLNKKKRVQEHYQSHQEILEEARLRSSLGEYTQEKFQGIETEETQELKRLEGAIKDLEQEEHRFRELFPDQVSVVQETSIPPVVPKPSGTPAAVADSDTAKVKLAEVKAPPPEPIGEKTWPKLEEKNLESSAPTVEPKPVKVPLLVHLEKDKVVEKVPVDKTIEIGRSPANHIVLNEPKVSRRHAEIQHVGNKYVLVDLESSNGTYVAGKKVKEYPLQPNDEIKIGNATLVFQI